LEWGTVRHAPAAATTEDEAAFRARVTTAGEFSASYTGEGVGADVYSFDGLVYISAANDTEAEGPAGEIVLSCAQMSALARDWLRYRGRWPWMHDE